MAPKPGGGSGGEGGGRHPPAPPAPSGVNLPSVVSGVPPRDIPVPLGLPGGRGRRARSGRPPTGQCGGGGGGGEGGGTPPPWFAPPSSPGWPLKGLLRLRRPGLRRSAVRRQRARRAGVVNGSLECPPQEGPHPYQDLPGGFSRHLQDALFPPWIIGRGSMTASEARIVGEEWAREWGRWCAATRAPATPAQRYAAIPVKGWGPDTRLRPTAIRGAGPDQSWDAATGEWLQAAPGPQTGWTGDVSSLVRAPVPPRIVLHAANILRATEMRTWAHAAATVWWHPPEDGAAQLAVAHFKAGGPVFDDALSRLGDTQGPLLLMLPTGIAAALRQELDGCEGLRVGWEAVADGTLLALLHRDTASGCQWDALTPHLTGRHVYMATPPQGHPRPTWDDLIAAFHDHGILPDDTWQEVQRKTLGKDYRRRVRARLLEIRDPLRQRWDDLWLRHLDPWSPPSHLPHTCRLCGECDKVSSAASTGANRCARCAQVAVCPWPEPPQARAGAQRRRPCTGASRGRTPPHTNERAPRALPFCGSTCTCGTPHPLRTCRTCSRPNPHPPPPFAEPAAPCHADGGKGRDTPGPAAKRRRRPSGAWWRTRWRRHTKRTLPHGVT